MSVRATWLLLSAVSLVAACGGGGDDAPPAQRGSAPVAMDDAAATVTGQPVTIAILANDTDPDGAADIDPATVTIGAVTHGTTSLNSANGDVTFTPDAGFTGNAGFGYVVSDRSGNRSQPARVAVTVNAPSNAAPTLSDIADREVPEDGTTGRIDFTVADADTQAQALTVTAESSDPVLVPGSGLALGGGGPNRHLSVTPAANRSGTATITVRVSDGTASASDTFVLTVTPVNDPPVLTGIADQTTDEDVATPDLAFSVGDLETAPDALTVTAASSNATLVPASGLVLGGSGKDRTIRVEPAPNQSGTATITLTVRDADGAETTDAFDLTVAAVNDAPTISDVADQSIAEDTATGELAFTIGDLETAPETLTVTAASSNTALVQASGLTLGGSGASRTLRAQPQADQSGTTTITLTVADGGGARATDSFVLTVATVNDRPVANPLQVSGDEDTVLTGQLSASDVDSAALTYKAAAAPAHGTVTVASDGAFSYTPAPNYAGADSFTFVANDGALDSEPATVTITLRDVAEPTLTLAAPAPASEAAGTLTFTATLSRAPDAPVTLSCASTDGTAVAGRDYTACSGTRTFTRDSTSLSWEIAVPVNDDTAQENDESFSVTVTADEAAAVANRTASASGTILDNDAAKGLLRVGAAKRSITPCDAATKAADCADLPEGENHIDGVTESRALGGAKRLQPFNLGAFGINPFSNVPNAPGLTELEGQWPLDNPPAGARVRIGPKGEEHTWLRTMVMEDEASGELVVFVMIDAPGAGNIVQKRLKEEMIAAAGDDAGPNVALKPENILFGQTHSHAGADLQGLWGGVPQHWVEKVLYPAAADAVVEALNERVPARLTFRQGHTTAFNSYRRPRITPGADADGTITLLEATSDEGAAIGNILQYNAHPTGVGAGNRPRVPHADYILGAMDWLEDPATGPGGVALYFNGPIADSSKDGRRAGCNLGGDYGDARCRGEGIAAYILDDANVLAARELESTIEARSVEVLLPVTNPGFLAFGLAGTFNRYYNFMDVATEKIPGIEPFLGDLPQLTPVARTWVSRITLGGADGGLEIVTIPGEATNTFGQQIRALAKTNVMLLGLTHNSFGYILPEEEFHYVNPTIWDDPFDPIPGTAYEEHVSLGPLTAPVLRAAGYVPLFHGQPQDQTPDTAADYLASLVPPVLATCFASLDDHRCLLQVIEDNVHAFFDIGLGDAGRQCREEYGGPEQFCAMFDLIADAVGDPVPEVDFGDGGAALALAAIQAQAMGCDMLDPSHCLLPFPNDHFTVDAAPGSPQGDAPDKLGRRGTGKRINFNLLAMPRNSAGKPIDPAEWNRNDGFSPGQLIVTYVPNIGTVKDGSGKPLGPIKGAVPITDIPRYLDADAPILVIDTETGERHPIWAEINLDAGYLLPMQAFGPREDKKPALLIRPARNFVEDRRYVVVLRNLQDEAGARIPAQAAFKVCRDELATGLPPLQARCAELEEDVFPVLDDAGIARDDSLYLAWDFTVASARNNVARLERMRDDAFASLGDTEGSQPGDAGYPAGAAPTYTVTRVTDNPDGEGGKTVRRIQGTLTVPSYVIAADPSPLDGNAGFQAVLNAFRAQYPGAGQQVLDAIAAQCRERGGPEGFCAEFRNARGGDIQDVAGIAASGSLPPNRLHFLPDASSASVCDPDAEQAAGGCALQARYGDGLPDRNPAGDLTTTFTCNIPRSAVELPPRQEGAPAPTMDDATAVKPVRPTLYGHGLLGGHGEGNGQASDFGNRYGFMTCMTDWFGFATGDVPNVATVLVDLSNFGVVPDGTQQGILNQLFLARLAVHPQGFAADPLFQVDGRPVFDRREVFYHGNSQGGIVGGVVLAASKDVNRGMLGVPGMNYSTLLSRSTDFASYSVPMYLSYPDDLDRPFLMSLMQMLWDRSENNGYAGHMTSDAMHGPDNAVLLHPAFGDHQVTMWSVDVMARTIGARVDRKRVEAARHPDADAAEYALIEPLDYGNAAHAAGSALVPFDEAWLTNNDRRCHAGSRTAPPPIGNVPPERHAFEIPETGREIEEPLVTPTDAGDDPHECPRRDPQARCQTSHFLQRDGALVDPALASREYDDTSHGCPAITIADVPAGGEVALDLPGLLVAALNDFVTALQDALAALAGGDPQGAIDTAVAGAAAFGDAVVDALLGDEDLPGPEATDRLYAGAAEGLTRVPVGTPLGGYLRPPVGGDWGAAIVEGAEDVPEDWRQAFEQAFKEGKPDPLLAEVQKFIAMLQGPLGDELLDFVNGGTDHDGVPLAPVPDEARVAHSPYATISPPSRGYYDSLVTKAVALRNGDKTVVLVKLDMIGMIDEVVVDVAERVRQRTGVDLSNGGLMMSGTHTHDGPGALANNALKFFWVAMDLYQHEVYVRVVDSIADVVVAALGDMQPARFGYAVGVDTSNSNRFRRKQDLHSDAVDSHGLTGDQARDYVRQRIGVLRVDAADGAPLAAIVNYSAHGIAFGVENQFFSGDVMGSVERELSYTFDRPVVVMSVQSAGGDVSPDVWRDPSVLQGIERFGKRLAPVIRSVYDRVDNFDEDPVLNSVSQRIKLNPQALGYADGEYPYPWGAIECNAAPIPDGCLVMPPPDADDLADNGVAENKAWGPGDTRLTSIRIGDAVLIGTPGETLTELGRQMLERSPFGRDRTFIWGTSQDHIGYLLANNKADWSRGGTEGTTTFWGWKLADRLHTGYDALNQVLLGNLKPGDAGYPADEFTIRYTHNTPPATPARTLPSARPGRVIAQPEAIERFEATTFSWEGGDPVVDLPRVEMQRLNEGGQWEVVRRANGTPLDTFFEMHLEYQLATGAHQWMAHFEAPKDWATGTYRFVVDGTAAVGPVATASTALRRPYSTESVGFAVAASDSLRLSTPVAADGRVRVAMTYEPQPGNYRIIDTDVKPTDPAPVRRGSATFTNGTDTVVDADADGDGVYEAAIAGAVTVSGRDVFGNMAAPVSAGGPPADQDGDGVADAIDACPNEAGPASNNGCPEQTATGDAGYGSGVIGLLAEFMADLNDVITAVVLLDQDAAQAELEEAFEHGEENGGELGESGSVGEGLGLGAEPEKIVADAAAGQLAKRNVEPVVLTGAQLADWSQPEAQGIAQNHFAGFENFSGATAPGFGPRNAHAGIFAYPAGWQAGDPPVNNGGADVARIAAYKWNGTAFEEVPVQVDERFPFHLANGNSTFSFYSGIDTELTYAWDEEGWGMTKGECEKQYDPAGSDVARPGTAGYYTPFIPDADPNQGISRAIGDPIAGLDHDDEIVFMAKDAGALYVGADYPAGWESVRVVKLSDPLNPADERYVYLVQKDGGSSFTKDNGYVRYTRKADADQWIDTTFFDAGHSEADVYQRNDMGTSNKNYGSNLDGTVCENGFPKRASSDRFPRDGVVVTTDQYRWEASGRWMVRDLRVRDPDESAADPAYWDSRPDLIDRWKGRAFQQSPDSVISVVGFEDEQVNWEANSTLLGERCGAVRCMREVWGADSGTNVTKTETFYRDAITYRYHVRVHPIPPDGLYTSWDYNRSAMVSEDGSETGGRYYTVLRPQGVPVDGVNDDVGQIDRFPGCRQLWDTGLVAPVADTINETYAGLPKELRDGLDQIPFVGVPNLYDLESCAAFFDAADPTFNLPLAFYNWEQVSGRGNSGSLVYTFENKGNTSYANPLVVPYYRDDACLDDGTGDDPVQRPFPGDSYVDGDGKVPKAYNALAGKSADEPLVGCEKRQGAYAAHGIHYFVTHDTDNAFLPATTTEIDGQQWQFIVPTNAPQNVAEPYANVVRAPLKAVVVPVPGAALGNEGGGADERGLLQVAADFFADAMAAPAAALVALAEGIEGVLLENDRGSVAAIVADVVASPGDAAADVDQGVGAIVNGYAGAPTGQLLAGVGVVDMTPDVGYGTGQHGRNGTDRLAVVEGEGMDPYLLHKKLGVSYGVQSRLTARAIVVQGANGTRIALLKTDNYLAQDTLVRRVAQLLSAGTSGIGADQILYHVTHDHSSAYNSTPAAGVWAFQDAFDPRFFEFQARRMAEAIEQAAANLRPARMGAIELKHTIFKGNITGPQAADDGTPAGYPKEYGDHGLVVMRFDEVDAAGEFVKPIAVWVNWGEHPESLSGGGWQLHSADYLAPLERFVEDDLGAPLVFSQGDVGSAEKSGNEAQRLGDDGVECAKQAVPDATCRAGGVPRDWNRKAYVQHERAVRYLADDIARGWHEIATIPADSTAARRVPFSTDVPVGYLSAWVPGPLSHPYPAVSNCRSEPTAGGDAGLVVAGLPDCARASNGFGVPGELGGDEGEAYYAMVYQPLSGALAPLFGSAAALLFETMKAEGVPVPESYDAASLGTVEENARLRLQAFRLGEVLLASCACEAQVDLILNLESRLDPAGGKVYDGFDWACVAEDQGLLAVDPEFADECRQQREEYYDLAEFPTGVPGGLTSTEAAVRAAAVAKIPHMRAQVHNDAAGWDAPNYVAQANAEPANIDEIKGNFTNEEIQDLGVAQGFRLPVGIGHAGDYNGYTVSYREFMAYDHYRKALTAYGPHTADYMVTRLVRMAAQLKGGAPFTPELHEAVAAADEVRMQAQSLAIGQTTGHAFDAYYAALPPDVGPELVKRQPRDIGRFNAATFAWRGGSTAIDNPYVVVESCLEPAVADCAGSDWQAFGRPSGEVQTRVDLPEGAGGVARAYGGQQEWIWSANFEAYEAFPARLGSTPAGHYRFVAAGCISDGSDPASNLLNRIDDAMRGITGGKAPACLGGSRRYRLASAPFQVFPQADVVRGVTSGGDGDISFEVSTTSMPRSYASPFPFVNGTQGCGDNCSFRPWAQSSAGVASVTVTVGGTPVAVGGGSAGYTADTNGQPAVITVTYTDGRVGRPYTHDPARDRDGDGVADGADACPDEAGPGTDGCPASGPELPTPYEGGWIGDPALVGINPETQCGSVLGFQGCRSDLPF